MPILNVIYINEVTQSEFDKFLKSNLFDDNTFYHLKNENQVNLNNDSKKIVFFNDINELKIVNEQLYLFDNRLNVNKIELKDDLKHLKNIEFLIRESVINKKNYKIFNDFLKNMLSKQTGLVKLDELSRFANYIFNLKMHSETNSIIEMWLFHQLTLFLDPGALNVDQYYKNFQPEIKNLSFKIKSYKFSESPLQKIEYGFNYLGLVKSAHFININRRNLRIITRIIKKPKTIIYSIYELLYKFIPVDEKMVIFENFNGKSYSDSPKYLYEYMMENYSDYKYIWVVNNRAPVNIPGNPIIVTRLSKEYFYYYARSKFWIANTRLSNNIFKKENQIYFQTWHGTPLKKLGHDIEEVKMKNTNTLDYRIKFDREVERWDYLLSANKYSTKNFESAFRIKKDKIIEAGYPRNDILYKNDKKMLGMIKDKLEIDKSKKVILYAPTWRDDNYDNEGNYGFDDQIDWEYFNDRLKDDYVIIVRMHYLVSSKLNILKYKGFIYDLSNYPDIAELYLISDILITDYSSVFFDFSILKRPILFYCPDLNKYRDNLRGFYLKYEEIIPGPIFQNSKELTDYIKNDINKYNFDKLINFSKSFNEFENGQSSQFISEILLNYKSEKEV